MPVLMACTIYNICRDVCYYCIMKQLRYVIKNRGKIRSVTKVWKMEDTKSQIRPVRKGFLDCTLIIENAGVECNDLRDLLYSKN